jgi:hypothetical protein
MDTIKVVTDPLGFAAFVILLGLRFLAKRAKMPRWLTAGILAMAFVALLGGLIFGYYRIHSNPAQSPSANTTPRSTAAPPIVNEQHIGLVNQGQINQSSQSNGAVNAVAGGQVVVNNNSGSGGPQPVQGTKRK